MKKFISKNWPVLFSVIGLGISLPGLFIHGIQSLEIWQSIIIIMSILFSIKFAVDSIDKKKIEKNNKLYKQKEIEKKHQTDTEKKIIEEKRKLIEDKKQDNFYRIFKSLANDISISESDLIYLAKNACFPNEFPIAKLLKFDFKKLLSVTKLKQKIVWHNDMESILKMYNSFYNSAYVDEELELIIKKIDEVYHSLDNFEGYESLGSFKKMVKNSTPSLISFWDKEARTL